MNNYYGRSAAGTSSTSSDLIMRKMIRDNIKSIDTKVLISDDMGYCSYVP